MRLPNPICWLQRLWLTLRTFRNVEGCLYQQESRLNHCIVTVLRCQRCGKYEVLWERTARSTDEPRSDERTVRLVTESGGGN